MDESLPAVGLSHIAATADEAAMVLMLRSVVPAQHENTRRAGRALLDVLRRIDELALVSFRVSSRDGCLHAGLVVESFDRCSATNAASRLRLAIESLAPWLTFDVQDYGSGHPLALADSTRWASRLKRGDVDDEMVRAVDFSPTATAMVRQEATLSVSVTPLQPPSMGLVGDVVVASDEPTDVLAALLIAELDTEANVEIETRFGPDAELLVSSHRHPAQLMNVAVFADVFSLPVRAGVEASWLRQPVKAAAPAEVLEAVRSAPTMHRWLLGRTGVGKSTLMHHLIEGDLAEGKTVVVIDPHGGLVDDVVSHSPADEQPRIDYLDFGSESPPALDPLWCGEGEDPSRAADRFVEAIRSMWEDLPDEYFGPVFDRILRFCTDTVIRYGETSSLSELMDLLRGDDDMQRMLARRGAEQGDQDVAKTLVGELSNLGSVSRDGSSASLSAWVSSKLSYLVTDRRAKRIFSAEKAGGIVERCVEANRVMLVRVPVGLLGTAVTKAVCQLIVSRLSDGLGERLERRGGTESPPVALYIDEWALVAEPPIRRLLAEGRKYGFELTLANQSIRQMSDPARVAGNVGTLALFRVGPAEAGIFAEEFATMGSAQLRCLPPYQVAVRPPLGEEVVGWSPPPIP